MSKLYNYQLVNNCETVFDVNARSLTDVLVLLDNHYKKPFTVRYERHRMAIIESKDTLICFGITWNEITNT